MVSNTGLFDYTRSEDLSGVDEILQNDRARATFLPVTLTGNATFGAAYNTTKLGQNNVQAFGPPRTGATGAAQNLLAADVLTGIVTMNATTAFTLTFDSAANFVAALNSVSAGAVVGDQLSCLLINTSASNAITLAVPASGAFDTNQANRTIAANTSKWVIVRLNNVTGGSESYTVYF